MKRDLLAVATYLGFALVPYLIERIAFKKRFGIFAILFWLFALQFLVTFASVHTGEFLERNGWSILAGFSRAIGAVAFVTIGIIPFILLPLSILIALVVLGLRQFRQVR